MWLVQAVISFLVVFALGLLIRWIINKARKPNTSQPTYAAPPPPAARPASPPAVQTAFCTNCGRKIEGGSAFCTNCGTRMG